MAELSREWVYWCLVNGIPAAGATLLFLLWPRFGERFAWTVQHRQSGIFLGTGFLLRAGLFVTILLSTYWDEIRWMVWGNTVFAGVLLVMTMVYGERFHWRRPVAILWLFLYIEEPVWMFFLVPEARLAAAAAGPLAGSTLHPLLVGVLGLEAALMLVVGLYLFFLNKNPNPQWPWRPDLVSQRILAGWPLGWAAWALTLALAGTWTAARYGVLLNMVWLGAVVLSLLIYRRQFDLRQRATRLFLFAALALLVLLGAGVFVQLQAA